MVASQLRVVRSPPGLVWRALEAETEVGAVTAFLRPDHRWFVTFEACREDAFGPLLAAVTGNTGSALYSTLDDGDEHALEVLKLNGFSIARRESTFLIPTDPAVSGLRAGAEPDGVVIISGADAYEDQLRLLDDGLRQDVPGADGWKWHPGDFYEETFDSQFDPATYLIAVDTASGAYMSLVRVWNSPGRPRLGLIGTLAPFRRRGLATMLLARAFRVLHERGKPDVTAEIDDTNSASRSLLLRPGAQRIGGSIEVVRQAPVAATAVRQPHRSRPRGGGRRP